MLELDALELQGIKTKVDIEIKYETKSMAAKKKFDQVLNLLTSVLYYS